MDWAYDLSDLMHVTFKSDRKMPNFLHTWPRTVQGLSEPQPKGYLRTKLFEQLQKSHALRPDMHYFDRLSRDHEDKTYQFFLNAAKRYVDKVKKKNNRDKTIARLSGGEPKMLALPVETVGVCQMFATTSKCRFGDRCKYSHDKSGAKPDPKAKAKANPKAKAKGNPKDKANTDKQDKQKADAEPTPKPSAEQLAEIAKTPREIFAKNRCRFGEQVRIFATTRPMQCVSLDITVPAIDMDLDYRNPDDNSSEDDESFEGVLHVNGQLIHCFPEEEDDVPHIEPHLACLCNDLPPAEHTVQRWAIDTASANHLMADSRLENDQRHKVYPLDRPRRLATANGILTVRSQVNVRIDSLGLVVSAITMPDSPSGPILG